MIEYVTNETHLNQLRSIKQSTIVSARISVESYIKNCFFCEDPITTENSNKSHLIPESFLKKISVKEFGREKVCSITLDDSLQTHNPENFFNSGVPVGSAAIFFGICRNCDSPEFFEYENHPTSELNSTKMREISLKTLLAFRYFSLLKAFDSQDQQALLIEEACKKTPLMPKSIIEAHLSKNKTILDLKYSYEINISRARKIHNEALRIKRNEMSFSKIIDFEIEAAPVTAVQSFYICGERIIYVNLFPTDNGTRVIVFKNSDSAPEEDDRFVLNLSIAKLLAQAILIFRSSIFISPKISGKMIDGTSMFELLGPRSTKLQRYDDLKGISMKNLILELDLDDRRMYKLLHEFL